MKLVHLDIEVKKLYAFIFEFRLHSPSAKPQTIVK